MVKYLSVTVTSDMQCRVPVAGGHLSYLYLWWSDCHQTFTCSVHAASPTGHDTPGNSDNILTIKLTFSPRPYFCFWLCQGPASPSPDQTCQQDITEVITETTMESIM